MCERLHREWLKERLLHWIVSNSSERTVEETIGSVEVVVIVIAETVNGEYDIRVNNAIIPARVYMDALELVYICEGYCSDEI